MNTKEEHELAEVERIAAEAWDAVPAFYRSPNRSVCFCPEHRALTFSDSGRAVTSVAARPGPKPS